MRRFAVAASVSLIAFASAASAAPRSDDFGYLPPPAPAEYQRTLNQVAQMPAFKAQIEANAPAAAPLQPSQPAIRYAQNYQVPAVPDYLPVSRMAAQSATGMYGSVQPAGFAMQDSPAAAPAPVPAPAYAQQVAQASPQPYASQPSYAAPQPALMAAEPVQPVPQPMMQPAPSAPMQPQAMAAADMQPQSQQPQYMPLAPQPGQPTMAYQPPVMDGNPRYDAIDVPHREPSLAYEPASGWRKDGIYAALRAGFAIEDDTSFKTAAGTYDNSYNTGFGWGGALGYAFRPWARWIAPRLEGEFSSYSQDIDSHTLGGIEFKDPNAYGRTSVMAGLFNGYFDLSVFDSNIVQPYVGGGVGFGVVDFDRHGITTPIMDNDTVGFAWQAGAGLGIRMMRGTYVDVGYRYQMVPSVELEARDGTKAKTDIGAHQFNLGLRYTF